MRTDDLLSEGFPQEGVISDWSAWLREEEDRQTLRTIRKYTRTGLPCGVQEFIDRLEKMLGRPLRSGKTGPKPL